MKFTDGFWLPKKGFTLYSAAQVHDVRVESDRVTVWATNSRLAHRGMTLGGPMLTLTFTAPQPDILSVRVEHYQGIARREPSFALSRVSCALETAQTPNTVTVSSGKMSAIIERDRFAIDFMYDGKRLTGLADRHLSYVTTPDGAYIRVKLDVDVGEKLYGLGERFTPFVKNGQSLDIWNEDGGTASEQAYKNIPFYITNKGYGVFVNSTGRVSYELCSEAVASAQFSLPGESLEFMMIGGPSPKDALARYVGLTGKPALPPAWSFGLWLSTSFTTDYNEETVSAFVDGMCERGIPLRVFHFDCFWMKSCEWCNFTWDPEMFPDPVGMLRRLHEKGLNVCVWINPYIAQKSPLFEQAMQRGYLLKRANGDVWQWDMWQSGMGLVDFTNPDACAWYQGQLKQLLDQGVDCLKTDFGERIPTDCVYFDGSDPVMMHNYYTLLYNKTVFDLLRQERGEGDACVFARSATVGGQQYPVHWGGDSTSNYSSMAESLRAGLSLSSSGFAFWSHDISGFEDMASPDVYKRWAAFGLLSTHSRLHGSSSYRVPWMFGEEAVDVVRMFTRLKHRLMPYLFSQAVAAHETGVPVMRAMFVEFPDDPGCEDLDRQYMLGESLLVAPVFRKDGEVVYYLPQGVWTHLLTGERVEGGGWRKEKYGYLSLPLFVRPQSLLAVSAEETRPDYDYRVGASVHVYALQPGDCAAATIYDALGAAGLNISVARYEGRADITITGEHGGLDVVFHGTAVVEANGGEIVSAGGADMIGGADAARVRIPENVAVCACKLNII
ncbi:MAG: alpha-xylosidase [Oscillospiraceae bacterium]|jgi:alpha-D-xyloside xylohydrolase|nr:alpha-xylosidase [Oscillospiraceae bacterium]